LLSTLLSFFPLSVLVLWGSTFFFLLQAPNLPRFLLFLLFPYLYPLLCFRLLNLFHPLKEGRYNLSERQYNPWWGSHQIQLIYFACPWLEAFLRLIPGLYSAWLRLWGAKIGKAIYWTPNIKIDDRPLVEIGDQVLFGHQVHLIGHVILPHKGQMRLFVKKTKIGKACFLGAGSRLGPGVVVEDGVFLPMQTDAQISQVFSAPATGQTE